MFITYKEKRVYIYYNLFNYNPLNYNPFNYNILNYNIFNYNYFLLKELYLIKG